MDVASNTYVYTGVERRSSVDRRILADKRANVRFDANGGDRRATSGRRSSDESLEVFE